MGETMDSWPAGASFLFHINIANEGTQGASNVELIYTAGEGTEFEVLYGSVQNNDTVARSILVYIDTGTGTEEIVRLFPSTSVGAGSFAYFPHSTGAQADGGPAAGAKFLISGPMRLRMQVVSVADGQDATFSGVLRLKGQAPTRSTVGAGTEVVTVNIERVV